MIDIRVDFDLTVKRNELSKIPKKPGIYVFYTESNVPIYVGQTDNLNRRIKAHFKGFTNTSRFCDYFHSCSIKIVEDKVHRAIYELYLILTYGDVVNIRGAVRRSDLHKSSEVTKSESYKCLHVLKNGEQCSNRPTLNGYCYLHGGEGKSRREILDEAIKSIENLINQCP
ncbi:GIY-YIG nuclease family protein [Saccharococcus thermophilus]|uniref:GIY-YIG domain-containing protein n=1 Tax=Saccharococcus thermophilus TaxID=29396 RepID=A0A846MLT9_9BACL|nr:GIY-YIG nuclease family protein [Saccharococcus thermophilus]NIK16656.1 hypothetical protein [Saccharococcus thermophilus]